MTQWKRIAFVIALSAILFVGAGALAVGGPISPIGKCIVCTDVFFPVICDGGLRFTSPCFANCFGATNCVPDPVFGPQ